MKVINGLMLAASTLLFATSAMAQTYPTQAELSKSDDPSVPPTCYHIVDAAHRCSVAFLEGSRKLCPRTVPQAEANVGTLENIRKQLPIGSKRLGYAKLAENCRGAMRTFFISDGMNLAATLQQVGAADEAAVCRTAMDELR